MNPKIAYTLGEPAGIGADIILQLAQSVDLQNVVCIGDAASLEQRATQLNLSTSGLEVLDVPVAQNVVAGKLNQNNAAGVLAMLDRAIDGCLSGEFAAMVTGPVHKAIINDAGVLFSGHTEYLAERTNAPLPVMMLASSTLRVVLVTTHLPLKDVSAAISQDRIKQICQITHDDLQTKFAIKLPVLKVCGLNPHAGEGGHLGMEEIDTIIPALTQLQQKGMDVQGPYPADTLFTPDNLQGADVVVAMYHDQGLPVLKSSGFGEAANITLGLPIIRTSVDHGTALDLAGTGKADTGSLRAAIAQAKKQMVKA